VLAGTACAPGIHPRSEALVQATRDLARSRTTVAAVEAQRQADRELLVAVQRSSGLEPVADGMLEWADLFRPLVEATDGLAAGSLVRFLDGNTFYRAVEVEGPFRLPAPLPPPALPAPWLGTLPSPFALAHASAGAATPLELAEAVLAPQIEAWARAGCGLVVLAEPFLPREPQRVGELLPALARLPRQVPLALQLSYGDAAPLLEPLADAEVDAVGIDFYATALEAVPVGYPKELLAGVVDVTSSLLEEPREVAAFAAALQARRPAGIALALNGDLEHVPQAIGVEKLRRLGAAATAVSAAA
jgi:methionine synthase II (cobalamin-independent)